MFIVCITVYFPPSGAEHDNTTALCLDVLCSSLTIYSCYFSQYIRVHDVTRTVDAVRRLKLKLTLGVYDASSVSFFR